MVKEFLSQESIGFQEIDISLDRKAKKELVDKTGEMSVPVTIINGQVIVGFEHNMFKQIIEQL